LLWLVTEPVVELTTQLLIGQAPVPPDDEVEYVGNTNPLVEPC